MKNKLITLIFLFFLSDGMAGQSLFSDNFENNLQNWEYTEQGIAEILKTEDSTHNSVLKLTPNKSADCVLIKNSDNWKNVVIEGQALFPTELHDYLGLVYNYQENDRIDFGCIYIKGKGSYIRVNPHRDGNASRALYEEYKTALTGEAEIKVNQWFSFKAEIIGSECHFYVTDMKKPKVIFKYFEYTNGKIGFKPRLVGGEVWLDNISVNQIEEFSYSPADSNDISYIRESMINDWHYVGPFNKRLETVENSKENKPIILDKQELTWSTVTTDARGCMLAGKVCRYSTEEKYAYYSTQINSENEGPASIQFSSLNNLHVWVNTQYIGSVEKQRHAWYDFIQNPEHAGRSLPLSLKKGNNRILILVEGANYSGDGFYAHLKKEK